jgi:hypothetical protein
MDRLTFFGLFAFTAMLLCYALEDFSPWFYPGLRGGLRGGVGLRLFARGLVVRSSRGHLVPRRATVLAGQEAAGILRCEKFGASSKVT